MDPRAPKRRFRPALARLREARRPAAGWLLAAGVALGATPLLRAEPALAQRSSDSYRAVLELEVNGARYGDVIVFLTPNDALVPLARLRDAGIVALRTAPVRYAGADYVSLRHSDPHLRFRINEVDLVLEITAPPAALAKSTVDLSEPAPPGLWYSEETSAYLTYAPSLLDASQFRVFTDAGVTSGAWRLTSTQSYEPEQAPVRLMTQAVFSDRRFLREFIAGDTYANTGPLGGSVLIGGFGVFRNFELDPYFIRIPQLAYRGSVMAPSTVDVYVNNVLVRRVPVAPGQFDLRGIAPASGAGNVRYVIRDPLSRQNDVVQEYYAGSSALAEGISEYSYAAGFRRDSYGIRSFDYDEPLLVSRYRLGVGSGLTVGGRAELGRRRVSTGAQLTLAGSAGEVDLAGAGSIDRGGDHVLRRGAAASVGYYYQSGAVSLRSVIKLTTARYVTASLEPGDDRDVLDHSTSVGWSVGPNTSISTLLGLSVARDAGERARFSASLNHRLTRDVSFQVLGTRSDARRQPSEYELIATLNVALPESHTASLAARAARHGSEATLSVMRPIVGKTGLGYQASGTLGELPRYSASAQAQTTLFRADASVFSDGRDHHSLIDASGSLVWMNGAGLFLTRPVYESFAVVEVTDTPGATVFANNQEAGKTNGSGLLFVPDLLSYYGNRIRADATNLPEGTEIDDGEVIVAPPPHGGALVTFASRRLRAIRGRLAPRGIALEDLRYGEVIVTVRGNQYRSPIGAGGEFEFEGVPAGEWTAEAISEQARCTALLRVPVTDRPLERLGAVACEARGSSP